MMHMAEEIVDTAYNTNTIASRDWGCVWVVVSPYISCVGDRTILAGQSDNKGVERGLLILRCDFQYYIK